MSLVGFELQGSTAVLRMDDGKANALGYEMMDALDAALDRAEKEASAVVLAGRAGRFCAGFDLKVMMSGPDQARAVVKRGAGLLLRLYSLPMPLIIACGGHALAGGALVVLTGDVRVGARGAFKIGLNEVQLGMPLPILGMEFARDRLAPRHLTAATLFASIADPSNAVEIGWLDQVEDDAGVMPAALAHAARLGALPRVAYAKTKESLRGRTVQYIRDSLEADMIRLTPPTT